MKRRAFLATGGALAASLALPARAAYPEKPVHYIIPFPPGGESDIGARLQQLVFRRLFGQELVIESKPGAGGGLAWSQLNMFPGDGYTIMGTNLPHIVLQPLEGQVQYKTDDITNVHFYHFTPASAFRRSCAAWFAEFVPEPARLSFPGLAFAAAMKSLYVLNGESVRTTMPSGV